MSITIYRVQDRDGRGPYKPGVSKLWRDSMVDRMDQPAWFEEFTRDILNALHVGQVAGCGFRTMDQLRRWFSEAELARLRELGYEVVEVEAIRILAESSHQIVFSKRKLEQESRASTGGTL